MSAQARRQAQLTLVLGGEPRVDLLPPEVLLAAKAKATRRILILLVILAVIVVGGGTVLAAGKSVYAQTMLFLAQNRTVEILAEQANYAEATRVAGLLTASEQTRVLATSNEIIWSGVFDSIASNITGGSEITGWTASTPAPWLPQLGPAGALRQPRIGTVTFTIAGPSDADAMAVFTKLPTLPGFADATVDKVSQDEAGGSIETTITLNLNADALSKRFTDDTEVTQ